MTELAIAQKKELAKILYIRENLTQKEIAERVGISAVTINKWVKDGNWEKLKVSITITREEQLNNLYRQLAEMNTSISERLPKEGKRYATPSEADTIGKLAKAIKQMETEVGLSEITSVFSNFIKWLRPTDGKMVREVSPLFDAYVKSKLS